jgi:DNA processing protein
MTEQDLFYLLALQRVEGVGDIMAKKLLTHCSAEAVFQKNSSTATIDGVGSMLLKSLKDKSVFEKSN